MSHKRVVVIGSGVAGASTAFALARRGVQVTIVDAAEPAAATLAGAGIIQPWSSSIDGAYYELYARGADYYPTLLANLAQDGVSDVGFRRTGAIVVSDDVQTLNTTEARLRERAQRHPIAGEVRRLSADEAQSLFPVLRSGLAGIWIEGAARVDGRSLRIGLLSAAERRDARMLMGSATIQPSGSGHPTVRIGTRPEIGPDDVDADIVADAIVVAAGAWTNTVLEPLGVQIGVSPQRGQISHLRVTGDTSGWPSVSPIGSHYLVAFDDSRVVVGATREADAGFDARVTAAGQREVLDAALATAPALAVATLIETRVGLRPLSDDGLPHIGAVPGQSNVFVATGFGAGGLTMGPVVGDLLAAVIADADADASDALAQFAPRLRSAGSALNTRS
jgi:D-amino-acid dehydrogenase